MENELLSIGYEVVLQCRMLEPDQYIAKCTTTGETISLESESLLSAQVEALHKLSEQSQLSLF